MAQVSVEGPFGALLRETAALLAKPGKGLLAADESTGTIGKRLASIEVENTEQNRLALRRMLFSTEGLQEHISGVILFEETLYQNLEDGTPLVSLLSNRGILLGIKVDTGVVPLAGTDGETTTQGLDDLAKRCDAYRQAGARFAKWRAVLKISDGCPSARSVQENARTLARYASVCQQSGLVPIVEPEVLADGNHSAGRCAQETERVVSEVVKALSDHGVLLEGMLLKVNMVTAGSEAPPIPPEEVAERTVRMLRRTLPPACPGVTFLSGGQAEEEASLNLNAMNRLQIARPWTLSFSFGRALQASALKLWGGQAANEGAAQAILLARCRANGEASLGKYSAGSQACDATERLHVADYKY